MLRVIAWFLEAIYKLLSKFFGQIFSRMWVFLIAITPEILKKIFAYLGIGLASYVSSDYLIGKLTDFLQKSLDSVPADILVILQLCKFDKGIAILISALTIAATIKATTKTVSLTKAKSQ